MSVAVDIVVNNFNYGRFVTHAIDSALAQTHPAVRVIVVDDGSTDESRDLLSAYANRVELVLKENGGQASALNAGFERVTGDVVIILDADDALLPSTAAVVASTLAADASVVKVQYRMEVMDELGRRSGVIKPPPHLPLPQGDLRRAELVFPFDIPWLTSAFRVEALRRILPIPEQKFAECPDWYLVHLSALLGPVASVESVGALYRVHSRNRYEPRGSTLDLNHVRQSVAYAAATTRALDALADDLGLEQPYPQILSVADLANRLVSHRLEPALHPIRGERTLTLLALGFRATSRRFDVSWPMKVGYALWFAAAAVAPKRLVRGLAELFAFPDRRGAANRLIKQFHRSNRPIRRLMSP